MRRTVRKDVIRPQILRLLVGTQRDHESPRPELLAKQQRLLAILAARRRVPS